MYQSYPALALGRGTVATRRIFFCTLCTVDPPYQASLSKQKKNRDGGTTAVEFIKFILSVPPAEYSTVLLIYYTERLKNITGIFRIWKGKGKKISFIRVIPFCLHISSPPPAPSSSSPILNYKSHSVKLSKEYSIFLCRNFLLSLSPLPPLSLLGFTS